MTDKRTQTHPCDYKQKETHGDVINRQAAIDAIRHIEEIYVNNLPTMIDKASAQTELMLLPSVQPEEDWTEITVICDNCGHAVHAKREDCRVSAEPEQRWSRLMMHLADLQLTYSPNWGANGQGDQKLYDFVTGLIEELEGWEDKSCDGDSCPIRYKEDTND